MVKTETITAPLDKGAICSFILQQTFKKIADKMNLIRKPLRINTVIGATLGPIGIAPLDMNIEEQNSTHNFVVCTKLKQHLILGQDFVQRYKIGIDWDIKGKLFLRCKGKKIASSLKTIDSGQWMIASLKYQHMNTI